MCEVAHAPVIHHFSKACGNPQYSSAAIGTTVLYRAAPGNERKLAQMILFKFQDVDNKGEIL
jgi:hypothetical protein